MTNVQAIMTRYRQQMTAAGLLKPVSGQVSPRLAVLRPSIVMVRQALTENPHRFSGNSATPFSFLFNVCLPKLEPVLIEMGEAKAEQIVRTLCEHGAKMIRTQTTEASQLHLEALFGDLLDYGEKIGEENWVKKLIKAYQKLDFENKVQAYLKLLLGDKILELKIDHQSPGILKLAPTVTDFDLICLRRIKNLAQLDLWGCEHLTDACLVQIARIQSLEKLSLSNCGQITGAGFRNFCGLPNLKTLSLSGVHQGITDTGLVNLQGCPKLENLDLSYGRSFTDAGLAALAGLPKLKKLDLGYCYQITDAGLDHLADLPQLKELVLWDCHSLTNAGLAHLKRAPNLQLLFLDLSGWITLDGIDELKDAKNSLEVCTHG